MDLGWYDVNDDVLYFIELKDWQDASLSEDNDSNFDKKQLIKLREQIRNHKIRVLVEKSLGVAAMISSMLLDRSIGQRLLRDLHTQAIGLGKKEAGQLKRCISSNTRWAFYHIANWKDSNTTYLNNLNDRYRNQFKGYADLFQVRPYHLITKTQAMRLSDNGTLPFGIS